MLRDTVLTPGRELPLAAYVEAIETAEAFRRHLDDIFAEVDRAADPERRRRGARGARLDRRPELQLDLDPGLDAVRDTAGRNRPEGAAARRAAGRPALPRDEAMLDEAASVVDRLQSDSTLGAGIETAAAPARKASSRRLRFNAAAPPRVW